MPVDNRNFIIEDLPDDPEDDGGFPGEDDDDEPIMTTTPQAPWGRPQTFTPPPPTTIWGRPTTTINPNPFPFQTQTYQQPGNRNINQTRQNIIDRRKKIIFCDLLDILIESESAVRETINNGYSGVNNYKRSGIMPRGLYDIRLKTEVWGKLAAFGADYVFCITNQPEKSEEDLKTWKVMTDYVMYALADYLNLPHQNCKCFTKLGFSRDSDDVKPGCGLMKRALQTIPGYKYTRKDLVVVGVNSGYQNQSDIDKIMASRIKVDYVDVNDLLTTYY